MGCTLCKNEQDCPEQVRSISVAKQYFHKKNTNLERKNFSEDKNTQYTSQLYKKKLISLLEQKRRENEKSLKREQETYLDPFQKIVESTKAQKYESLVLNMIAAKAKAEQIVKKNKKITSQELQDSQVLDQITKDREDLFKEMIDLDYVQNRIKRQKYRKQGQETIFLQNNQSTSMIYLQQGNRQSVFPQLSPPNLTTIGQQQSNDTHQQSNDTHQLSNDTHQLSNDTHQLSNDTHQLSNDTHQLSNDTHQLSNHNGGALAHQSSNESGASFNNILSIEKGISQNYNQSQRPQYVQSMSYSQNLQVERGISLERGQQSNIGRVDGNYQQSQMDQNVLYSMVDVTRDYQSTTIQVQKYLFNYLYEKVSNNQHIVKSLIDEFGYLISDKFNPIFANYRGFDDEGQDKLSRSDIDCFLQMQVCIENDIKFLISLIKEYLKQIYGENVLPDNLFDTSQQNIIFDVFVRKIVFDNDNICSIAQSSIQKNTQVEQALLSNFTFRVRQQLTIKNAFIYNEKLKFLSNYESNPFQDLDEHFLKIQTINSPFLKKIELKSLRNSMLEHLKRLTMEQKYTKQLQIDEYITIYYFILTQTDYQIYKDIKIIEIYSNKDIQDDDYFYTIFAEAFQDFIEFANDDLYGVENFIDKFFHEDKEKFKENQQIKEEDESASLSQISRLSNHQHDFQFNNSNNPSKLKQTQGYYANIINAQSASSYTITDGGDNNNNNNNNNNNQLIFSSSDILCNNREKSVNQNTDYRKRSNSIENNKQQGIQSIDLQRKDKSILSGDFESQQMISTAAAAHSSFYYEEINAQD